jgi:restriction system protein
MDDMVVMNEVKAKYTSTGRLSGFMVDLYHKGLQEHKHIAASQEQALKGKVSNQVFQWQNRWEKEQIRRQSQSKEDIANEQTIYAHKKISAVESILEHTLNVNDAINWDNLRYFDKFSSDGGNHRFIEYGNQGQPISVVYLDLLTIPKEEDYYKPVSFFAKIFGRSQMVKRKQEKEFNDALNICESNNERIKNQNAIRSELFEKEYEKWERERIAFENRQVIHNERINELQKAYLEKSPDSIVEYCEMVLNNSQYPDTFPRNFDLQYNPENKMLLVDFQLPSLADMPIVSSYRYIKSRHC